MHHEKTIAIADRQPLFRQALRATILPLFEAVDILEPNSLAAVLTVLAQRRVDLLLLDLRLKGTIGFQGVEAVRENHPEVPVFAVIAGSRAETARSAMRAGVYGCIPRAASPGQVRHAVAQAIRGTRTVSWVEGIEPSGAERRLLDMMKNVDLLSPVQHQVLDKMAEGLRNREIARTLGLSESTVKSHVASVLRKLGAETRTQAALASLELRYRTPRSVSPPERGRLGIAGSC